MGHSNPIVNYDRNVGKPQGSNNPKMLLTVILTKLCPFCQKKKINLSYSHSYYLSTES